MAKSQNSATPRKGRKNPNVAAEPVTMQLEGATAVAADPELSALMDALDAMPGGEGVTALLDDEVLVQDAGAAEEGAATDAAMIEGALANIEAVETMLADATVETPDGTVSEGAGEEQPAGDAPLVAGDTETPAKVKVPRKHYTNKADRIADRLGDQLQEYTVLTAADAVNAIDDDALKAKMDETMAIIRGMNKKCQNRASLFMEFVAGKKAKLNEVIERALKVLAADGKITTGKEGNLLANLLARPYSEAAARAMGGNTVSMLEDLRVLVKGERGVYLANPDSLLLSKANALLGLGAPAALPADEPEPESESEPEPEGVESAAGLADEVGAEPAAEPAAEPEPQDEPAPAVTAGAKRGSRRKPADAPV